MTTTWEPTLFPGCEPLVESTERPVHPAAALFPMLSEEELAELAADIQTHGLLYPIVLDQDGALVDGRNRLAACQRAQVEPTYEILPEGADAVAYILSANIHRRHLSKGQAAMAVAQARSVFDRPMHEVARAAKLSKGYVVEANVVLQYAPDLVEGVRSGARRLAEAYATARARKDAASSTDAQLARLQAEAPDLALQVVEETLTLAEALAALAERERWERQQRETTTRLLEQALLLLNPRAQPCAAYAQEVVRSLNPVRDPDGSLIPEATLYRCIETLAAIVDGVVGSRQEADDGAA